MAYEQKEIEFLVNYFGEDFREMSQADYAENLDTFRHAVLEVNAEPEDGVEEVVEGQSEVSRLLSKGIKSVEHRMTMSELLEKHVLGNMVKGKLHEDLQRDVIVSDILEQVKELRGDLFSKVDRVVKYYNRTRLTDEEIVEQEEQEEREAEESKNALREKLGGKVLTEEELAERNERVVGVIDEYGNEYGDEGFVNPYDEDMEDVY